MLCRICETRKPRRYCPGVNGDICSICCGTEREQTVHCPFDCEYLREARKREEPPIANPDTFPNNDIRVTEQFLRSNEQLLAYLSMQVLRAALEIPNVVDADVKAALEAMVRTYRTLESGLYYETRPDNLIAGAIVERLRGSVDELRKALAERSGVQSVRDADILGVLAFLQRMEIQQNNGRRLGRAFIDFLREGFPMPDAHEPQSLIV